MFHSWDRPAKSIAKIADFGHSLVISAMSDDPNPSYIRYTGTSMSVKFSSVLKQILTWVTRYNAPEVQNQLSCPIDRTALHKCDVWAFGLLVWETILDGEEYTKRIADCEATSSENGKEPDIQNPEKFLELAKSSLPFSKSNLRDGILRWVLNMTIQVNPAKRISNLAKLPLMSKWQ
ncbi:hypothetical protein F5B20DRAFT_137203 [Whalleya microplaca]|nr:hypothetical protein F5B20DRAFT_137203 [Whalleya microplaca]